MNNNKQNGAFQNVGALWKKTSAKGVQFLAGNVEIDGQKYMISVWKNTFKGKEGTNENAPDYRITSPIDGPQQSNQTFQRKPAPKAAAKPARRAPPKNEDFETDPAPEEETPEADF